jgi:hypothetical protein
MTIFHAFYVMSFTATTIGFGEIPYPFHDAQRMWVTFSIYMSVIGWAYTLASVDRARQRSDLPRPARARAFREARAPSREPFYILCGYGQSGSRLALALDGTATGSSSSSRASSASRAPPSRNSRRRRSR